MKYPTIEYLPIFGEWVVDRLISDDGYLMRIEDAEPYSSKTEAEAAAAVPVDGEVRGCY